MNKRALLAEAKRWRAIAEWTGNQPVQGNHWPPTDILPTYAMKNRVMEHWEWTLKSNVALPSGERFRTYIVLRSLFLAIECEEEARCAK